MFWVFGMVVPGRRMDGIKWGVLNENGYFKHGNLEIGP